MIADRKKPTVAFWATVIAVVVLMGYPLSFGPACSAVRHELISKATAAHLYRPILRYSRHLPSAVFTAVLWYAGRDEYEGSTFAYLNVELIRNSLARE